MPYCPKCDMEFVEGVTVCSDCGGPLFESVEAAEAARKEEEARALEAELKELAQQVALEQAGETTRAATPAPVYVKKSEHYNDLKSSASAFLLMGCVSALLTAVLLGGIVPVTGNIRWVFGGVCGVACLAFFSIWSKTKKDMVSVKEEAAQEEKRTKELVDQFVTSHPADHIDRQLAQEAAQAGGNEDTPEELSLKRYGLIQDLLVTENDLPDPSYVDALSEEIYDRLFGKG